AGLVPAALLGLSLAVFRSLGPAKTEGAKRFAKIASYSLVVVAQGAQLAFMLLEKRLGVGQRETFALLTAIILLAGLFATVKAELFLGPLAGGSTRDRVIAWVFGLMIVMVVAEAGRLLAIRLFPLVPAGPGGTRPQCVSL